MHVISIQGVATKPRVAAGYLATVMRHLFATVRFLVVRVRYVLCIIKELYLGYGCIELEVQYTVEKAGRSHCVLRVVLK